jgi:hypothetical protein
MYVSGTKTVWVIVIILTGVVGAIIYFIAGSPGGRRPSRTRDSAPLTGGHEVTYDSTGRIWDCIEQGCDYSTLDVWRAREHRIATGAVPEFSAPPAISGFKHQDMTPSVMNQPQPGVAASGPSLKTCPDCAEEVRLPARKCRFCGYIFADVSTQS